MLLIQKYKKKNGLSLCKVHEKSAVFPCGADDENQNQSIYSGFIQSYHTIYCGFLNLEHFWQQTAVWGVFGRSAAEYLMLQYAPQSGEHRIVRGKGQVRRHKRAHEGIIPACAGKRLRCNREADQGQDHPRLCGEKLSFSATTNSLVGSSPPVRGKVTGGTILGKILGIIPACAGKSHYPPG